MGFSFFAGGRRLLLVGFGGLLALMLAAGVDALLVLRKVRASDTQVRDAYLSRSRALDKVRNGIYQSAIAMREYLLMVDDPTAAQVPLAKWAQMRERTDQALRESAAVLDASE